MPPEALQLQRIQAHTWIGIDSQRHGLVVPTGVNSTTGIAGLTLGGGFGWMTRKFGLTIDSLRSARLVDASGKVLKVDRNEHPELFWAIRGGGGNFGIVTEFEFDLHAAGPTVLTGWLPIRSKTSSPS